MERQQSPQSGFGRRAALPQPAVELAAEPTRAVTLKDEVLAVADALWQGRNIILATTALCVAAAIGYLLLTTPRYLATAQILIDPRAKRIVEGAVVPGGFGSSAVGADTLLVDSQVELLYSSAVLSKVVEKEGLATDPEFLVARGAGMRMRLRNWLGSYVDGYVSERAPAMNPAEVAMWRLKDKHLSVRRAGNTYVLNVSVFSQDAEKAARITNAVAQAYISDQSRAANETTRAAASLLRARADELRGGVERAERAVEDFRARNGLIGTSGLLVSEQQLQSLNEKLSVARSQTALAKARYEQVRALTPQSAALSAQSDALKSPVIANLRGTLARVERREAIVERTLGPRHPDAASLASEKASVIALIGDELARIKANAEGEHALAAANERALETELKSLEGRAATNNQSLVRLRELQREAQAARQVYETFLTRAKETREQEDLGRDNTRVITPAATPTFAASPPTMPILAGSLVGGAGLGSLLAWLVHILRLPRAGVVRPLAADTQPAAAVAAEPAATALPQPPPARPLSRPAAQSTQAGIAARSASARTSVTAPAPVSAPAAAATTTRRSALAGLARRPVIAEIPLLAGTTPAGPGGSWRRTAAGELVSFADHISAVDEIQAAQSPKYRSAIDFLLQRIRREAWSPRPRMVAVIGSAQSSATSSTALALAYRSALTGTRTLLIDASAANAELSVIFAGEIVQGRPCELDNARHLKELVAHDTRSGLALLPLALIELAELSEDHVRQLATGLGELTAGYELIVIDAGAAPPSRAVSMLLHLADSVLVTARAEDADSPRTDAAIRNLGLDAGKARLVATMAGERTAPKPQRIATAARAGIASPA